MALTIALTVSNIRVWKLIKVLCKELQSITHRLLRKLNYWFLHNNGSWCPCRLTAIGTALNLI